MRINFTNIRINNPVRKLAFAALFSFLCFNISGQKLLESRQTSYFSYIYKLADKEAEKTYKNDLRKADRTFFHSLVDSFPTESQYTGHLPQGHYLQVHSERNREKYPLPNKANCEGDREGRCRICNDQCACSGWLLLCRKRQSLPKGIAPGVFQKRNHHFLPEFKEGRIYF